MNICDEDSDGIMSFVVAVFPRRELRRLDASIGPVYILFGAQVAASSLRLCLRADGL